MRQNPIITGTGFYHPPHRITNDELVESYNAYVDHFNQENAQAIEAGEKSAMEYSSAEFIEKASGIKQRYVLDKKGVLDIERMRPYVKERPQEALSLQAEMAIEAIKPALEAAQKTPEDIDAVIVSCTIFQRQYPAISVEIQKALNAKGFAFDMNMACSSATFGLSMASDMIRAGRAKTVVVVSPEMCSALLNFRDRESHFIFGDAATAVVIEAPKEQKKGWEILSTRLETSFSNNIRSDVGCLTLCEQETRTPLDQEMKLFNQNGRKVFKEVVPLAFEHILEHCEQDNINAKDIRRYWLHQANSHMNLLIAKKLLNKDPSSDEAPFILDQYANTAGCGSVIAFHLHHHDLKSGDIGVLCSFGAGYSVGSLMLRKL